MVFAFPPLLGAVLNAVQYYIYYRRREHHDGHVLRRDRLRSQIGAQYRQTANQSRHRELLRRLPDVDIPVKVFHVQSPETIQYIPM